MDKFNNMPDFLTVKEVSKILRISLHKVYDACRNEEIPHTRIGGSIRIPKAWIVAQARKTA